MPKYKLERTDIVRDDEAKSLVENLIDPRDKAMVCMFYLFGCRPAELLTLMPDDFEVREDKVFVTFPTKKKRKGKSPISDPTRRLWWPLDDYFMNIILDYKLRCPWGSKMFDYSSSVKSACVIMNRRIKAINKNVCLYLFRHSRNTQFDEANASNSHFVYWNGWADERPRKNYRHVTKEIVDSMPIKSIKFDAQGNSICESSDEKKY